MLMMPFQILGLWLRALLSVLLIGAAVTLFALWYSNREKPILERRSADGTWVAVSEGDISTLRPDEERTRWVSWQFGMNRETFYLLGSIALAFFSLGGGWLSYPRLFRHGGQAPPSPRGESITVKRPDGTELHVEIFGPANGIPVILTHGWSLNSDEWAYAKAELAKSHRVVVWDLPGLGRSTQPKNGDFSLEKMARDLDAVIDAVAFAPVVLLGHSIGGMIILTYCKLFPEKLETRVRGLVIAQSTYTNPVNTTQYAGLMRALQKPVLEPMAHLMIWLSPVVRLLNWASYINGSGAPIHRTKFVHRP